MKQLLVTSFSEKLEEALLRVTQDANASTKISVNAVTEYAKGLLPQIMTAGATEAVKAAKAELSSLLLDFTMSLIRFKRWLLVCVIISTISTLTVSVLGLVVLLVFKW